MEDTPRAGCRQALIFTQGPLHGGLRRSVYKLGGVSHAISPRVVPRMKDVYLTLSFDIHNAKYYSCRGKR